MWKSIVLWCQTLTWWQIGLAVAGALGGIVLSYIVVSIVIVRMPVNYFHSDREHHFLPDTNPVLRSVAIAVKNIIGVLMILIGIVLSLPAVPGPGLVTVFIGLMITDIPGKRVVEAKIIKRPLVLSAVNRLRARYNRPALVID